MNNYCGNCGNKLNEGETKCLKCGFNNKSIPVKKVDEEKCDTRKGNILALVAVCFILISIIASKMNSTIGTVLIIPETFIIVYARIAYPKNIFVKILFILFLVFLISYILYVIWLMLLCNQIVSSCY